MIIPSHNDVTFKLVMVRGADDPDDRPGHQVHPAGVGKLHQLPGHRDERRLHSELIIKSSPDDSVLQVGF